MLKCLKVGGWAAALLAASVSQAQTEVKPPSAAQSLSCLVKPAKAPDYPERDKLDRGTGAMRLKLSFSKPDASPTVEVLFNSARQDMQDRVFRYVSDYRLPCLTAADGTVSAVQEFSFNNSDRDATPLPPERSNPDTNAPFCLVMPRRDMADINGPVGADAEHVVAVATFSGDGQQPPEVKFVYSSGSGRFQRAVADRLAEYRMPCRRAGQEPQSFQQQFSMFPTGQRRYGFKREAFGLIEFLGITRNPLAQPVRFDFNTMGCPFKLNYKVYGGAVPNEVHETGRRGKPDPNKLPFMAWLASLNIAFSNDKQANDLFGSELQIQVPCTVLDTHGAG